MGGEKGPVHLVTDVGFAQIKKQIPNSSSFLSDGGLQLCMRWCCTQAEYLGIYLCQSVVTYRCHTLVT